MKGAEEVVAFRPLLYGIAYRILGSAQDAEDVLQDAFLKMESARPRRRDRS
jgi:RNA polymerase sigma-70 factor (ECF subfamily)